jgi:hypothetical protein
MEQCGIGDGEGLPQQMGQLQLLEILKLRNNAIGGVLPEGLFSCTRLETIDLSGNLIRGTTPGPRELGRARSAAGAALTEQQHRGRDPGEHWWLHLPLTCATWTFRTIPSLGLCRRHSRNYARVIQPWSA